MNAADEPLFTYHTPMKDKLLPSIMSAFVLAACVKVFLGKYIYPVDNQLAGFAMHAVWMVIFYLLTFRLLARMDETLIITLAHFFVRTKAGSERIAFADMAQFSITRHQDHRPQYTRGLIEIKLKNGQERFAAIFLSQSQIDQIARIVNGQLQISPVATDNGKTLEV